MMDIDHDLLIRLANHEDIRSSDRPSDAARTRLKNRGLIIFDREKWRWHLTYAGRDALAEASNATQEEHAG
jgi:hypothetical protein